MACQSKVWATNADSGRPIAPPTPSVALIAAIAVLVRSRRGDLAHQRDADRDEAQRHALQRAADQHRRQGVGHRADQRADDQQATTSPPAPAACRAGRRADRSSPSRPRPASRVMVTTQPALDGEVPSSVGQLALDRDDEGLGERDRHAAEAQGDDGEQGAVRAGSTAGVSLMDVYGTHIGRLRHDRVTRLTSEDARELGAMARRRCPAPTSRPTSPRSATSCCGCSGAARTVYEGVVLDNSAFRLLWVLSDGEPRTLRRARRATSTSSSRRSTGR